MLNAVGFFLNTIIKQGSYETVSKTMQNRHPTAEKIVV